MTKVTFCCKTCGYTSRRPSYLVFHSSRPACPQGHGVLMRESELTLAGHKAMIPNEGGKK